MDVSPAVRSSFETHEQAWRAREALAAKYLGTLGVFADIDPRLLAPDAVLSPPAELRFSSFADRTLDPKRRRKLLAGRLNDPKLADLSSVEALQRLARDARPASLAHLALEGRSRIEALAQAFPGRLLLPGTGLVTKAAGKSEFRSLIIDRIAADDAREVVEGPSLVLRVFDGSLDKLRELRVQAVFVSAS